MRDAGFRPAEQASEPEPQTEADIVAEIASDAAEVVAAESASVSEAEVAEVTAAAEVKASAPDAAAPPAAEPQAIILTHWRWVGLPKPRPSEQRQPRTKPQRQSSPARSKPQTKPERAPVVATQSAQPSSLALQLAALKGLKL